MKRSSDSHDNGEFRAVRGIQVEEEVVRMVKVRIAVGPRVVIDAAEAGQEQQGGAVVGRRVVNYLTTMFGIHRNRFEPVGHALAQIFLKESLAFDSVRIAAQDQGPVAEKGQNELTYTVVVSQEIPLGVAGLGKIDFVQVA